MEGITFAHITGIALTLRLIVGCGIYSGRQVKSGDDFSGGGRNSGGGVRRLDGVCLV